MKTVLVGAGGYGGVYLDLLFGAANSANVQLAAVVDPFAQQAAHYRQLAEKNIPIFPSLEAFYENHSAELVIISSPIQYHKPQTITALRNGSNVLCEKPVTALCADALEMDAVAKECGKKLGVGFQWSFSNTMQNLKRDIARGIYGKPLQFKTCVSWPRGTEYYKESPWKGRVCDKNGNPVHDSILTNATAHYLHNMFFVASSATKTETHLLYRSYEIETFDTCVIKGTMENGCEYFYGVTHTGEERSEPMFEYRFEKAVVYFDQNKSEHVYAVLENGETISYGCPQSTQEISLKIIRMAEAIAQDTTPLCTVQDVQPHQSLCNHIFAQLNVQSFSSERVVEDEKRRWVKGLWENMKDAYTRFEMPESL